MTYKSRVGISVCCLIVIACLVTATSKLFQNPQLNTFALLIRSVSRKNDLVIRFTFLNLSSNPLQT